MAGRLSSGAFLGADEAAALAPSSTLSADLASGGAEGAGPTTNVAFAWAINLPSIPMRLTTTSA